MKILSPDKWQPCDAVVLEVAADTAVRCSNNHVLVIAGPGAGKTELLAQKAAFLFQTNLCRTPQKILAISFKTDAAQNLKERVEQRCGADIKDRFMSMTYDAFAKSILDHFAYALPDELRPATDYLVNNFDIIDAAFRQVGYRNPDLLSPLRLNAEYEKLLTKVKFPIEGNEREHRAWKLLLKGFNGNQATLTFKMIMMVATYILKTNSYIKIALQMTYSFVFLDEFQDTTEMQYNFVKECFGDSNTKITAVGDNKQRIMVWAGAVKTIFNDFDKELKPLKVRLIMNHRSAPQLVELQKAMYESLNERTSKVCVSDRWNKEDGSIILILADSEQLEATAVSRDIQTKISKGVKPNDICILCKQKPVDYTSIIIEKLKKQGIRARMEMPYQDLIKEPIVDLIIKFLLFINGRTNPKEWRFIEETLAHLWNIGNTHKETSYDEMQQKLNTFASTVKEKICHEIDDEQWHDIIKEILEFFGIDNIKAKFQAYRRGNYFDDLIKRFEKLFFNEYMTSNMDWDLAIRSFNGECSIPIMTIHKSKGLEYSAVYFIGLEDSAFWNFKKQPEEDRCAFFVALSRAKESICFTFCRRRSNTKFQLQKHDTINEFFSLLENSENVKVLDIHEAQ